MKSMTREERMINLEKMTNTRDIGGYKTAKGYTKAGRFVRASSPANASDNDLVTLYDYGVRISVDLRSTRERESQPSRLEGYKDVETYAINMVNQDDVRVVPTGTVDLGNMYIDTIEGCKPMIKDLFEIFMKNPDKCVIYFCSAGKDRTGITTALLLSLAGCDDKDIVQDYSETYENNKAMNDSLAGMMDPGMEQYLNSDAKNMEKFLAYLKEHYGNAMGYLKAIGIDEKELAEFADGLSA